MRLLLSLALFSCGHKPPAELVPAGAAPEPPSGKLGPEATASQRYAADFQAMWKEIDEHYCCMATKATAWPQVRIELAPKAEQATTDLDFLKVVDQALDQLYDPAADLAIPPLSFWRPRSVDIWARFQDGAPTVMGVKNGSAAWRQAVRAGRIFDEIDSEAVETLMASRRPSFLRQPDPAADDWALRSLLAGRFNRVREFDTHLPGGGDQRFTTIKELDPVTTPDISMERWGPTQAVVRIRDFADPSTVAAFDAVIDALGPTTTLILDMRDNPGGDLEVARQILGRFAKAPASALLTDGPGAHGPIAVAPRGPWQVTAPAIVLVDFWTVGAAEAFAVGIDALGAGKVIGTRMGGEGVVTETFTLPNTAYDILVPTARLLHPNGTPVSAFVPSVEVDLATKPHGDPIEDAARASLAPTKQP